MLLRRAGAKRTPAPRSGAWMLHLREPHLCAAARIGERRRRNWLARLAYVPNGKKKTPKTVVGTGVDLQVQFDRRQPNSSQ
jgi:hypothetical protein